MVSQPQASPITLINSFPTRPIHVFKREICPMLAPRIPLKTDRLFPCVSDAGTTPHDRIRKNTEMAEILGPDYIVRLSSGSVWGFPIHHFAV